MRRQYYVFASMLYIVLGMIIIVRSVLGHVVPVGLLGIVLIALGCVRLRDYFFPRGRAR